MKIILFSDKALVETFHETSLHLNSYLDSATPKLPILSAPPRYASEGVGKAAQRTGSSA